MKGGFGRLAICSEGVQGVEIELQEPGEAVLVHDIDLVQLLHDEVEQASVVSRRRVLSPGLVQIYVPPDKTILFFGGCLCCGIGFYLRGKPVWVLLCCCSYPLYLG